MSKPDREAQLQLGEQRLSEWGLDSHADVATLRRYTGREPLADLAIAQRLGRLEVAEGVDALRALEAGSRDKAVIKEVRRSLFRLQQHGLTIPPAAPAPASRTLSASTLEGYLSAIDGNGDQLVWLLKPRPGGLAHLFAVINDPEGLREVELADTTRKALRDIRESLLRKHELRFIEADWRYCDFLIDRARRWAIAKQRPVSGDYPGLRAQLTKDAVSEMQPLILARLDAAAILQEPQLAVQSDRILTEPEFRTWFLDQATLMPYLEEIQQIKDSPLVLNAAQQQERFAAAVDRAIEELFGGEPHNSWVRRLEEMAYFFHVTGRVEPAKYALAAALALEHSRRGGREIGCCEQLVRGSLAAYLQVEAEHEEEQARSSLVVTPQQALREAEKHR